MDWVLLRQELGLERHKRRFNVLSCIMLCAKDTQTGKTPSAPEEPRHWFRVCLEEDHLPGSFHSGQKSCRGFKLEPQWLMIRTST